MTQNEMILEYINDFGSITTMQAYEDLGITRLPARIYDIRRNGIEIEGEMISKKNRYGVTVSFMRYKKKGA